MSAKHEKADKRIPMTPSTNQRLEDFKSGLGTRYADAIELLLDLVKLPGETDFEAGRRLREQNGP